MATPQNLRGYQFIGDSSDSGPGNTRTVIWPPGALGVPTVQTTGQFITSFQVTVADITAFQSAFTQAPYGEAWLKNNNPYWVQITALGNGIVNGTFQPASNVTFTVAIAPYQMINLPDNWLSITAITGGLPSDPTQNVPNTTEFLYFDYLVFG